MELQGLQELVARDDEPDVDSDSEEEQDVNPQYYGLLLHQQQQQCIFAILSVSLTLPSLIACFPPITLELLAEMGQGNEL